MRITGISSAVAEALIVLIVVASVGLLYAWLSGATSRSGGVKHSFGSFAVDAVSANDTGVYAWVRGISGAMKLVRGYLERPDGRLVAVLNPVNGSYSVSAGRVVVAQLIPDRAVDPGNYLVKLVGVGDDVSARLALRHRIGGGPVYHLDLEATGLLVNRSYNGYRVLMNLTESSSPYDYNLTVYVCAEPGYTVHSVIGILYNSSLKPPRDIGVYYEFVYTAPYTYPDCAIWYWTPLHPDETPYHVAILVDARSS